MEQSVSASLKKAGLNVQDALSRVNGSEALYFKLLGKFLDDKNYSSAMEYIKGGNYDAAKIYVHALKGLSANLSMTNLYEECLVCESRLKEGKEPQNLDKFSQAYEKVVESIRILDKK